MGVCRVLAIAATPAVMTSWASCHLSTQALPYSFSGLTQSTVNIFLFLQVYFCFNSGCIRVCMYGYLWRQEKKKTQGRYQPSDIKHKNKKDWIWLLGTPNCPSPGIVLRILKGGKALSPEDLSHSLCVRTCLASSGLAWEVLQGTGEWGWLPNYGVLIPS